MATLIIMALSNAGTMLLTAWVLHRASKGISPIPSRPQKVQFHDDKDDATLDQYTKGRPIV